MKQIAIIMGSISDLQVVKDAIELLRKFGINPIVRVLSAHRTPDQVHELALGVDQNNIGVIIAAAGKSAHLAGVIASYVTIPVIGLPIKSSTMDGLDSLLSIVQMPAGIPVATVAINGAENAAILAVQILAISDTTLKTLLSQFKEELQNKILKTDAELQLKIENGEI